MKTGFTFNDPEGQNTKVYFEQVYAEKPAGGIVANPDHDIEPTTALGVGQDGKLVPIKAYRLVAANATADKSIKIAKGSGIKTGDVIGHGGKAVACTNVNKTNEEYDTVTVELGANIPAGTVLFEAAEVAAEGATPKLAPVYVAGAWVEAGKGDARIRLINGANLRKETANVAGEVAALMPTIQLV